MAGSEAFLPLFKSSRSFLSHVTHNKGSHGEKETVMASTAMQLMQRSGGTEEEDQRERSKMEEMRLIIDGEIPVRQREIDSSSLSFKKNLDISKSQAQQVVVLQEKLAKLRVELREVEDGLVKALAAKTRKEAKRMAMVDSISSTKYRVEDLRSIVDDQRTRKDEYAAIISQQLTALVAFEEKYNQRTEHREDIEEAISWFNKFLGFRIECGHGVKFIFTKIKMENPNEEYSFSVRHENDVYSLIQCDPHLNDTKELINDLNKSNGLFKFVRIMREKFQQIATRGVCPQTAFQDQEDQTITFSAPDSSVSTENRSLSPAKEKMVQPNESKRQSRKVTHGKSSKGASLSPGSAISLRRSPRFKVKK